VRELPLFLLEVCGAPK